MQSHKLVLNHLFGLHDVFQLIDQFVVISVAQCASSPGGTKCSGCKIHVHVGNSLLASQGQDIQTD